MQQIRNQLANLIRSARRDLHYTKETEPPYDYSNAVGVAEAYLDGLCRAAALLPRK